MKPLPAESSRRFMAAAVLAAAALAAGTSTVAVAAGGGMGSHSHAKCDGPVLDCALKATPVFAPDGALWLAVNDPARVHLLRSTDGGKSFDPPVEITPGPVRIDPGADARPVLVLDGTDRLTAGYAVMTDKPFTGEIYYAHSEDGGQSFSRAQPVSDGPAGKRFLALGADPAGDRVIATWIDKRGLEAASAAGDDYAGAALAVAWSDDGGQSFGATQILEDHSCECCRIALDYAAPGQPALVWRNLFDGARDHAVITFRDPGTPGPVQRVSDDEWRIDACPHHGPDLAIDGEGGYHVTWFTGSDRRQGLFYARSTDGGRSFSEPMPIGTPGRQPARPQVLAAADGLWLAWQEFDGERTSVPVRHSTDGGLTWTEARIVATAGGMVDQPVLIADAKGRAFLSWLTRPEGYRLLPLSRGSGASHDSVDLET